MIIIMIILIRINPSHAVPDSRTASLSTWWIPLRSDRQGGFFQTMFAMTIMINYQYDQ